MENFSHPTLEMQTVKSMIEDVDNAVHLRYRIPSTTDRNGILGKLLVKTHVKDQKGNDRYFLTKYMCEIYDNEGDTEAFLYYKLDGENFIPTILKINEGEIMTDLGPTTAHVITRVFDATDENDLQDIKDSELIGAIGPEPEYQTVSNLLGIPSVIYFELDDKGGANIVSETLFEKIIQVIKEEKDIKAQLASLIASANILPTDVSEYCEEKITDILEEYKITFIDALKAELYSTFLDKSNDLDATLEAINAATSLIKTCVFRNGTELGNNFNHIITQTKDYLETLIINRLNAAAETSANIHEDVLENRSDLRTLIEDVQEDVTDKLNALEDNINSSIFDGTQYIEDVAEAKATEIKTNISEFLQSIVGINAPDGIPQTTLINTLTTVLTELLEGHGYNESVIETMDSFAIILKNLETIPQYYLGTIETLLNGRSRFGSKTQVVKPIRGYIEEIKELSKKPCFLNIKPSIKKLTTNIKTISKFMEYADVITANSVVMLLGRVFGPKIPIFDMLAKKTFNYSNSAHFSSADFGLYGWIKDLFYTMQELADIAENGATIENVEQIKSLNTKVEELLEGKVAGVNVIPVTYYDGKQNYLEITEDCADVINGVSAFMPISVLEKRMEYLAESIKKQEKTTEIMYKALRFLMYQFWSIDIDKTPECLRLCF
jgi:hypothetical protein